MATTKLRHDHPEDRFLAALRPLPALLEALWNLAYYATDRRRRKVNARKVSILKVPVWVQVRQSKLIERYRAHLKYLQAPRPICRRTLTRQMNAFRRDGLVRVINPSYFDKARGEWVTEPNVYTITYRGKLWIKRHARAVTNQLVV